MNLSKKTFLYSAIISGTIVTLMISYFVLMLPSLYVDYIKKLNFESIKAVQANYLRDGNYTNISSRNLSGTATIKVPMEGNSIFASNMFGSIKINIDDEELLKIIEKIRYYSENPESINEEDKANFDFSKFKKKFFNNDIFKDNPPITFEVLEEEKVTNYKKVSSKINIINENFVIYEYNVADNNNSYTTYMAISRDNGDIIISILPIMNPEIGEIRPIIFQSLPMIIAISLLIILISTSLFSRKIVNPIEKLVKHANFMKSNTNYYVEPIEVYGEDEIAVLACTLNELYSKLNKVFNELEEKNKYLLHQNERQEVFLRASSHQLKTPVAASLLLLEGMIDEVGKYKNTKEYLPKVKMQVVSMSNIINELLDASKKQVEIISNNIKIESIITESILSHEIQLKLKEINLIKEIEAVEIVSNSEMLYKIIDNIISNAINYTPESRNIKIILSKDSFKVINYGVKIEESLLPHIFDAFVSSNSENSGHGLGLYIVSYYSKLLNYNVDIRNVENGVEAIVYFYNT
ncbi:sensor histidine kinase [Clostridium gasigenes]|uniref:sensor histidine kinase n=1 Tax=Clostridium gasigenes TaxID=94869 RepID=UPI001C0B3DEA|nr:ATP-binding protein [Clostridium gasigenes]MBU3137106.1 sensor histidine kinase [Clostridium gasigenes]